MVSTSFTSSTDFLYLLGFLRLFRPTEPKKCHFPIFEHLYFSYNVSAVFFLLQRSIKKKIYKFAKGLKVTHSEISYNYLHKIFISFFFSIKWLCWYLMVICYRNSSVGFRGKLNRNWHQNTAKFQNKNVDAFFVCKF